MVTIVSVDSSMVDESNTQISNQTIQNSTSSKHYDVSLDEHVGIKTT